MMENLVVKGKGPGEKFHFDIVDYAVFAAMLLLSAMTGLYYGCRRVQCKGGGHITNAGKKENLKEYLTGSGTMKPFPVAMSLIASYISGVTILGTPAEIYNFGTQYWLIAVSIFLSGAVIAFVYLPVFTKLRVDSSYEYLEVRFSRTVRTLVSVLFLFDEILFLPILVYVPSLAFNQVTGINIHIIGTIVCIVCIFYTVLGGLKAVVWTDTWQIIVMFISVIVVVILGTISVGGLDKIIDRGEMGGRFIFSNFDTSMFERHTVLSVIIGGFFYWTSYNAVNQTMVQRYLSLPSLKSATISVILFTIGVTVFLSVCCYTGILIYATYYDCDPLISGRIKADDQLLPLFVMETVGHLRGVPGLFIAGVFGAALSSLSVVLNSTSLVILEDFIKGCLRMNLDITTQTRIVKVIVLVLGVAAVAFLFVVEHMGGILALATALSAIAAGTTFGIFTLGMLFPQVNNIGAIVGGISGFLISGWVSFGGQYATAAGLVTPHKLPVSVDNCPAEYNVSIKYIHPIYADESDIFPIFRLSYHWITPIGVLTVISVGLIVSYLTGKNDTKMMDSDLISPISKWMLPSESRQFKGTALLRIRRKTNKNDTLMKEITVSSIDFENHQTALNGRTM